MSERATVEDVVVGTPTRRVFATSPEEPRARRASDAIVLAAVAALLVVVCAATDPEPGVVQALERLIETLPPFLDVVWRVTADLLVLVAVALPLAAALGHRRELARDLVLAVLLAAALGLAVGRIIDGSWPSWDSLRSASGTPAWFPPLRVAVPAAVVMTASPHLTRPMRRLGRRLTAGAAFSLVALGAASALGALAAFLVAAIAAAAAHLALGSSGGRPGLASVRSALEQLGVDVTSLGAADRQRAGVFLVHATSATGEPLVIKVYGRDAHDTALVSTIWRTVWYREPGAPLRLGRLPQVEHEAFVTLLARQLGAATDVVVTAGATADDDALLVLRRSGRLLADTADSAGSPDPRVDAAAVWDAVLPLHRHGIAHGHIDDRSLLIDESGVVGLVDFGGASVGASVDLLQVDRAQVLATTAVLVGAERAVHTARQRLGTDGLAAVLPFLQPATLTGRQRQQAGADLLDVEELRAAAATAMGAEPPALQQLRRISLGAVLRVLLPAAALLALLAVVGGLDVDQLVDAVRGATWWLIALGVIVAQLPRFAQALSTLGAAPVPLPLGPVYALQLAVSYINLAVPSSAARIAINIRFFQRHGVPPGGALAAGALDGFGGFIVQALLLSGLLLLTPLSLDLQLDRTSDGAGRLLLVVAIIVAVAVATLVVVERLRRFLLRLARRIGAEARQAMRGLRSPRRLGLLFGGNLASEVLFALALGTFVYAMGFPVGLGELLLINISVSLLAGVLPIPGGVGVVEGGLTYGLVRAGVPEEQAFAAVILFRLSSFYVPPVWGFFAMRWLERNDHL